MVEQATNPQMMTKVTASKETALRAADESRWIGFIGSHFLQAHPT